MQKHLDFLCLAGPRMSQQAAVIDLPESGGKYPMSTRKSVVIIGGERCDEGGGDWPRVRQNIGSRAQDNYILMDLLMVGMCSVFCLFPCFRSYF